MSAVNYYQVCNRGIGRAVQIRMRDGSVHRGVIERVSPDRVYLRPLGRTPSFGGFSYGYYGGRRWGWGWGFGAGIALGAIASLAFIPFFW